MSIRRHLPLFAAGIAVVALLSACAPSSDPSETTAASASSETTPEASVDSDSSGAAEAGVDLRNPPEALGSITFPRDGEEGIDSVLMEVVGMRHVEDVLVVTFRFTGEGDGDAQSLYGLLGEQIFYPSLLDYENLKRYDHAPGVKTDEVGARVPLGTPLYAMATFAYPEGADSVDVLVNPYNPPITGVPVP